MKKTNSIISTILVISLISSACSVTDETVFSMSAFDTESEISEVSQTESATETETTLTETTVPTSDIVINFEENNPSLAWDDYYQVDVPNNVNSRWWVNYTVTIGNIPKEEVDEISMFLLENDFDGTMFFEDFDDPREIDLYRVVDDALSHPVTQEELDATEGDVCIYSIDEINAKLQALFGLNNEDFDNPLFVQHVNGEACVVCIRYDGCERINYNFVGGYVIDNIYTMFSPSIIVTLKKDGDRYIVLSSKQFVSTQSIRGETQYNPNTAYSDGDLTDISEEELNLLYYEYYARHNVVFDDPEVQLYFEYMTWYEGLVDFEDFDESVFNDVEIYNMNYIQTLLG